MGGAKGIGPKSLPAQSKVEGPLLVGAALRLSTSMVVGFFVAWWLGGWADWVGRVFGSSVAFPTASP